MKKMKKIAKDMLVALESVGAEKKIGWSVSYDNGAKYEEVFAILKKSGFELSKMNFEDECRFENYLRIKDLMIWFNM